MTETPTVEVAPGRPPHRTRVLVGAVVVLGLALTAVLAFRWGAADTSADAADDAAVTSATEPSSSEELSTADIFAALAPSVVSILAVLNDGAEGSTAQESPPSSATGTSTTTASSRPDTPPAPSTSASPPIVTAAAGSAGTGVIVNGDGSIMTALHVVLDASTIEVTYADGSRSAAVIAAADPTTDIAILSPQTLPTVVVPAVLGGGAAVGDDVIAIGNQLGLTDSATTGVVSGLDRAGTNEDGTELSGLIQFDAAVNKGSSGGPLVNANGETVGIVVALVNPTDAATFIGIGFAVPIGTALGAAGSGRTPQK